MSDQGELRYRDYTIHHDGFQWVAESTLPDDTPILQLGCPEIEPLIPAIDQIYDALANFGVPGAEPAPEWLRTHLQADKDERIQVAPAEIEPPKVVVMVAVPGFVDGVLLKVDETVSHRVKGPMLVAAVPLTFFAAVMVSPLLGVAPFFSLIAVGGASPLIASKARKRIAAFRKKVVEPQPVTV